MEQQKKKRGENWSSEEKEILRQLISLSRDILEDKSTKTSANMLKVKEWKNISNKFNEITGKCRSDGELKLAWKRMKLSAKSNLSAHRREQTKTGGGTKPPSPSPEDLEIMEIAPHDFIIETNDYDSDAVIPAIAATTKETLAYPKPGPSYEKISTTIVVEEYPEYNVIEKQALSDDSTANTDDKKDEYYNKKKTVDTSGKKKKKSLQNRSEEMRQTIVQSNINFKERQLEMMELEHNYNTKIANLKIKKLELEIALLESKKNTIATEK